MPIWTQEQLLELIASNHKAIKDASGKMPQEQLDAALKQTEIMETWLDAPFRDKLDESLGRVYEEGK